MNLVEVSPPSRRGVIDTTQAKEVILNFDDGVVVVRNQQVPGKRLLHYKEYFLHR